MKHFSAGVAWSPAMLGALLIWSAACCSAAAALQTSTVGRAPGDGWVRVYSDTAFNVSVDTSRVERMDHDGYLLWFQTRWAHPHQTQAPGPFNRETIRTLLRCAPLMYKTVHVGVSLDAGPVIAEQGGTVADAVRQAWKAPSPGSADERSFAATCAVLSSAPPGERKGARDRGIGSGAGALR